MSAPPYMKLYVGDYLGDTHHLGALEHGAYLLLLMAMWRAGGSLPAADPNLARMARCTPDQWAEVREVVLPYFKRSRGRLTHKRLAEELTKYENTSGKRSEAGKRGGRKTANENNGPAEAIARQKDQQLPTYPEPEPEPERIEPPVSQAPASDWKRMLEEATQAADGMADLTRPAMHHAADLRALVEPKSGEPCHWAEVLDAIRLVAIKQRQRGKPIQSWAWVRDDALALRDKRINAVNPAPNVVPIAGPRTNSLTDQIGADQVEARRRAFAEMDAENG